MGITEEIWEIVRDETLEIVADVHDLKQRIEKLESSQCTKCKSIRAE